MYLRDLNKQIKDFGWVLSRASGRKNTRWLVSCLSGNEYKMYCKIKKDLKNLSEKHFLIIQKANSLPRNVWLYRKYNFEIVFLSVFITSLILYLSFIPLFKGRFSVFLGVSILIWYFTSEALLFRYKRVMACLIEIQKEIEKYL